MTGPAAIGVSWSRRVTVTWAQRDGHACIRLEKVTAGADVRIQVRPRPNVAIASLPAVAGRVIDDGDAVSFVPRFAFLAGTTYTVIVDGTSVAELIAPAPARAPTTTVVDIYPTAAEVPRNLLRFYVWFSGPMSEGQAASHVSLATSTGAPIIDTLMPAEYELWDADHLRLTVLLDPARIKRGLISHRELGYPLRPGTSFRILVNSDFRDATGTALRTGAERRYHVGGDERRPIEPHRWRLGIPSQRTLEPLLLTFDRPLDHALTGRCLQVIGPNRRPVVGLVRVGRAERSWRLTPHAAWSPGTHTVVIAPILEDIAGNSVNRIFDRDMAQDLPTAVPPPATLEFDPR
jgi:hypothetical protein